MSTPWQFWPGFDRGFVNPAADHFAEVERKNIEEEALIAEREKGLQKVGEELGRKYGLKFIGTYRRHEDGVSVPKNPRLAWSIPPKRIIMFGFEIASAGTVGWRVRQRLAEGVVLSGKQSTGWTVWLEEKDLYEKIAKIFKPAVLPPAGERNLEQNGTLTNFGGHYRIMGATRNAQFWVICPDGSFREPDEDVGRGYARNTKVLRVTNYGRLSHPRSWRFPGVNRTQRQFTSLKWINCQWAI